MSQNFLGEMRMFGGNFAPRGWAFCNGQLLAISQNDALFALIGTTYGGDGTTTFGLPDLRGRLPMHYGQGVGLSLHTLGEKSGSEQVTLATGQMPGHNHLLMASTDAGSLPGPAPNAVPAKPTLAVGPAFLYAVTGANPLSPGAMSPSSVGSTGGNQPHDNLMPFQCLSFIIALEGIFPSRN